MRNTKVNPGKKFQSDELLALVDALDGQDQPGMPLLGLASRAGLPLETVRELVSKNPDYFVRVGGKPVYALNRFSAFAGSARAIGEDIRRREQAEDKKCGRLFRVFRHFFSGG